MKWWGRARERGGRCRYEGEGTLRRVVARQQADKQHVNNAHSITLIYISNTH